MGLETGLHLPPTTPNLLDYLHSHISHLTFRAHYLSELDGPLTNQLPSPAGAYCSDSAHACSQLSGGWGDTLNGMIQHTRKVAWQRNASSQGWELC